MAAHAALEKGEMVAANGLDIYTERVGRGPDVLLIGGLGDTVESWQCQLYGLADSYQVTAFDNRGAGRTLAPEQPFSVEAMADDAAGVLRILGIRSAHVAGFSGGSLIAQEMAVRHPHLVRSLVLQSTWAKPDPYLCSWGRFVHWLIEAAPTEQTFLHHDTSSRLPDITAPTLVLAGGRDPSSRPELGKQVADLIPGALFEVMAEEAHQPFQEVPEQWNARVAEFWREVDASR